MRSTVPEPVRCTMSYSSVRFYTKLMTVVNFLESSSLKFVTYLIKCFRVAAGKASVPKTRQLPGKGGGHPFSTHPY